MDIMKTEPIYCSIILPVYNEQENIPVILAQLKQVLDSLQKPYEIIAVDDGSTDQSYLTLKTQQAMMPSLSIIRFRRNFGKAAVFSCGFNQAKGKIVITMDADLQDDPMEIPRFISEIEDGADVVAGWKYPRLDPFTKTFPSRIFNGLVNYFCRIRLHDINCGFKAYRRDVIKSLRVYGGRYRFLPVFASNLGYKISEIKVTHHPRKFGVSKYGGRRFIEGIFDLMTVVLLTRFKKVPLHFFGFIGLIFVILGILCDGYLTVEWFMGVRPIGTRPLLLLGVLLILVGVQLVGFGLIGEMVVDMKKDEPNFIVCDSDKEES